MWVPDSVSQFEVRRCPGFEHLHTRPRSCSDYHHVRDNSRRIRAGTGKDPCRYITVIGGEPKMAVSY